MNAQFAHTPGRRALAALGLALSLTPVVAQQMGAYGGTTSQGLPIQMTISTDETGSTYVVDVVQHEALMTCPKSGQSLGYILTINGVGTVSERAVSQSVSNTNLVEKVSLRFLASHEVRGTFNAALPVYADPASSRQTESCSSGKVTFSMWPIEVKSGSTTRLSSPATTATVQALPAVR